MYALLLSIFFLVPNFYASFAVYLCYVLSLALLCMSISGCLYPHVCIHMHVSGFFYLGVCIWMVVFVCLHPHVYSRMYLSVCRYLQVCFRTYIARCLNHMRQCVLLYGFRTCSGIFLYASEVVKL